MSIGMNSYNNRIRSPEGTYFITIAEGDAGNPELLLINCGKSGSIARAWADFTARLISRLLETKRITLSEIAEQASGTRSDKSRFVNPNLNCYSGPEAIYIAITQYMEDKRREQIENVVFESSKISRILDATPKRDLVIGERGARRLKKGRHRIQENLETDGESYMED
jgi:hypothetical protein